MRRVLNLTPLLTAVSVLILGQSANASGWIVVDPVGGMPLTRVTPITPGSVITPGITAIVRPGDPHTPSPPHRPVLKGQVSFGLHLQSEEIKVDITDQVAKTYITQIFSNDTDRNLAGTYLFPLPEDTTFSSFSLMIDGKPVEGKILEAAAARQQYEEIVRRMVDPGLLEYADYKTVRARIFPIPAHGTKKVELEYTQVLKADNGMLKYRFPLKSEEDATPAEQVKVDMKLASTAGLRTIWSPSHTIETNKKTDHQATVSYIERNVVPDKDFLLYFNISDKDLAANVLTHKTADEDGYFLLTLSPPVQSKAIGAKDLVLVADTSGSMQGEKIEQAKKALKYIVNGLNPEDRFGIVQFSTDVNSFKPKMVSATAGEKKSADGFIDELEARGGTNISEAFSTAATLLNEDSPRPAYVVMMTDGEPTVGETDTTKLIDSLKSKRDVRVFDFGVGFDVNTRFLNKLAEEHHGTAQYVEPKEDIETSVSSLYSKIKSPVLTDVKLTYEGMEVKDVYPREVKDIFAGSQILLIGKYKGSGDATLKVTGKLNGSDKSMSFPLSFAKEDTGHSYLPRLWAMRRIAHLTEVAQANGNNQEVVDEIVELSKKYGIISQYTSFLVTDPSEGNRSVVNNGVIRGRAFGTPLSFNSGINAPAVFRRSAMARGGGGGGAAFQAEPNVVDERHYTSGNVERHRHATRVSGMMMRGSVPPPAPAAPMVSPAAAADVDHGSYMAEVERRSKRAWFPPKGNESSAPSVTFSVDKSGRVSNLRLAHSSGTAIADQAALKAIENAAPYSPLPSGAPATVDLEMTFASNLSAKKPTLHTVDAATARSEVRSALAASGETGEQAVTAALNMNKLAAATVAMSGGKDNDGRIKSAADKTFFLREGIWTDSSYDEKAAIKPQEVTFGSDKYFELLKKGPEIAKYLSVGKQVMFEFKGEWFKIVLPEEG